MSRPSDEFQRWWRLRGYPRWGELIGACNECGGLRVLLRLDTEKAIWTLHESGCTKAPQESLD